MSILLVKFAGFRHSPSEMEIDVKVPMAPRKLSNIERINGFIDKIYLKPFDRIVPDEYVRIMNICNNIIGSYEIDNTNNETIAEIYNHIRKNISIIWSESSDLQGSNFTNFYITKWDIYYRASRIMANITKAISLKNEEKSLPGTFTVCINTWIDIMKSTHRYEWIVEEIMKQISFERDQGVIDTTVVKKLIESSKVLNIYTGYINDEYISMTKKYFKQNVGVINNQYMIRIVEIISQETKRAQNHMPDTVEEITKAFNDIMIIGVRNEIEEYWNESYRTNPEHNYDIQGRSSSYLLLKRVNAKNSIVNEYEKILFNNHTLKINQETISEDDMNVDDKETDKNTVLEAIEIYNVIKEEITITYKNDIHMIGASDRAFKAIIQKLDPKVSENLAVYCDKCIRASDRSGDDDLDGLLNKALKSLYSYLEDKDIFIKYYEKLLARRLLAFNTDTIDQEKNAINILIQIGGKDIVKKMEHMTKDFNISTDITKNYQEFTEVSTMNAMITAPHAWPLPSSLSMSFTPALKYVDELIKFENYYRKQHTGKRLRWIHGLSKLEITLNFTKPTITVQVSSYQMAVLALFDIDPMQTYPSIIEGTQLPENILKQILDNFIKDRLLISTTEKSYEINKKFKPNKTKINLNRPLIMEKKTEEKATQAQIELERSFYLQSVLVRILKTHQKIPLQQLIAETIKQTENRFYPTVDSVKKQIEVIIEKEYAKKDEQDPTLILYIA